MDLYVGTTVPEGHTLLWIAPRRSQIVAPPALLTQPAGWWTRTFGTLTIAGPVARGLPTGFRPNDQGWRAYQSGLETTYEDCDYYCRWWLWPLYRLGSWLKRRARYVPLHWLVDQGLMTTTEGGVLRWRDIRPWVTEAGKARKAHYRRLCASSKQES